jgi:hypothetical protein
MIANAVHLQALRLQGFSRVVVPEGSAVSDGLDALMAEAGRRVVAADGVGQQQPWRYAPQPDFSLVSMLPHVFTMAVGDDDRDDGGGKNREEEA